MGALDQIENYRKFITIIARNVEAQLYDEPRPFEIDAGGAGHTTPWFHHDFRSDLEHYANILVRLEILAPIEDGTKHPCYFRFCRSTCDIAHMDFNLIADRPPFEEVLGAVIYARGPEWEPGSLFRDVSQIDDILPDLLELGYIREHDFGYIWLPKVIELQRALFPHWREIDQT